MGGEVQGPNGQLGNAQRVGRRVGSGAKIWTLQVCDVLLRPLRRGVGGRPAL